MNRTAKIKSQEFGSLAGWRAAAARAGVTVRRVKHTRNYTRYTAIKDATTVGYCMVTRTEQYGLLDGNYTARNAAYIAAMR